MNRICTTLECKELKKMVNFVEERQQKSAYIGIKTTTYIGL